MNKHIYGFEQAHEELLLSFNDLGINGINKNISKNITLKIINAYKNALNEAEESQKLR